MALSIDKVVHNLHFDRLFLEKIASGWSNKNPSSLKFAILIQSEKQKFEIFIFWLWFCLFLFNSLLHDKYIYRFIFKNLITVITQKLSALVYSLYHFSKKILISCRNNFSKLQSFIILNFTTFFLTFNFSISYINN